MSTLWQDVRFGLRTLGKHWTVTAVAVTSLAVALGGNAAVFSLVDALLFRPLPYDEPERLVLFGERPADQQPGQGGFGVSLPTFQDLEERTRTLGTWAALQPRSVSVRGTERAEAASGVEVTPSLFDVLGASALRGRTFLPEEGVEGGPRVAMISHEYMVERFGADADVLGEVLVVDGEPREIVGVLPPGFNFLTPVQDVWLPLTRSPVQARRDRRTALAVARMAPSATMEQVKAEAARVAERLGAEHPEVFRGWTLDAFNLRYDVPLPQTQVMMAMLQGSVFLVLVIACVNITNLLLARGQARGREIALRTVLGASRGRIVRQLLTESSVLVAAGTGLGLGLAALGIDAIVRNFAGALPPNFEPVLDHRVLLFTGAVAALSGLVFGVVPALQTFREGQTDALKEGGGGRGGSGGRSRKVLSRVLVVGEIALSFVALGGGSLLVQSFLELRATEPGFETRGLLTASVIVPRTRYPEPDDRLRLTEQLLERAEGVEGVRGAALVNALPQSFAAPTDSFRVAGEPVDPGIEAPTAVVLRTSPGYLETLGVELLRGRFFERGDRRDAAPVAVVNRALAEARFEGASPLGRRIEVDGEEREIVGVVADVEQTLVQAGPVATDETVYLPRAQSRTVATTLLVRTAGDPRAAAEPLREALRALDPDLALANVLPWDEYIAQFFVGVQVFNVILTGFGVLALLMAALGTYGVLAYSVSQRRSEIGIRMAVGAAPGAVTRLVAGQGIRLGVVGLVIGGLLTLPLIRVIEWLFQGLSTVNPWTLAGIAAVLFAVTLAASLLPVRNAVRVDPVEALKGG